MTVGKNVGTRGTVSVLLVLVLGLGLNLVPAEWVPLFHVALPFAVLLTALWLGRSMAWVGAGLALLALAIRLLRGGTAPLVAIGVLSALLSLSVPLWSPWLKARRRWRAEVQPLGWSAPAAAGADRRPVLPLGVAAQGLLDEALSAAAVQAGEVLLYDQEGEIRQVAASGVEGRSLLDVAVSDAPDLTVAEWVLSEGRACLFRLAAGAETPQMRLVLPISSRQRILGLVCLGVDAGRSFDPQELELLQSIVDTRTPDLVASAAVAGQTRGQDQRVEELVVLEEVARAISASLDLESTLRTILTSTRRLVAFDLGEVTLWDADLQLLLSRASLDAEEYHAVAGTTYQLDEGFSGWLARNRRPLLVADVPSYRAARPKLDQPDYPFRSYLGIPLESRGEFVGTLEVISYQKAAFSIHDQEILLAIGTHAATAIEHARLFDELRRRALELTSLSHVAAAVSSTLDLEQVLETIVASVLEVISCQQSAIFVLNPDTGKLRIAATRGYSESYVTESQDLDVELGGRMHAVASGEPVWVTDLATSPDLHGLAPLAEDEGVSAFADIPMQIGERMIGMLSVAFTQPHQFTDTERELLTSFSYQAAVAIENARLYAQADEERRRWAEVLAGLQRVAQELSSTFERDYILRVVLEEAKRLSGAQRCAVLLRQPESSQWNLGLCVGYLEEEQAALRKELQDLDEVDALVEMDQVNQALYLSGNALQDRSVLGLRGLGSALLTPIWYGERATGAIVLDSRQVDAFDAEVRRFVDTLATQAAVAISNARRYEEQMDRSTLLRRRADQLSQVLQVSQAVRSDEPLEDVLTEIAYVIQESVGFNLVLISVLEGDPPLLRRVACAGIPLSIFEQMMEVRQPWKSLEVVMRDKFLISQSYYIPAEEQERWRDVLHVYDSSQQEIVREPGRWHPQDMFLVPLVGPSGEIQGVLSVDEPLDGKVPDYSTVEALEVFAVQAAIAIENANLLEALQGRITALSVFNEISRSVAEKLDLDAVLDTVVEAATQLIQCHGSAIFLWDKVQDEFVARTAQGHDLAVLQKRGYAIGEGMVGSVGESNMPLSVADVEEEMAGELDYIRKGAAILAPLGTGGQVLGVLTADRSYSEPFSPADLATLMALADQVAVAVENARLFEEANRQAQQLTLINRIAAAAGAILDLDELLQAIYQQIAPIFQADAFFVALYSEASNELDFRFRYDEGRILPTERRQLGPGLTSHVISENHPLLIQNFDQEREGLPIPVVQGRAPQSWLGVPMRSGDQVVGVISVQAYRSHAYGEAEQQLLMTIADQIAVAFKNATLFDETVRKSHELSTLLEAGSTLSSTLDLNWVLQALGDRLMSLTNADGCLISEWDRDENQVTVMWELGDPVARPMLGMVYQAASRPEVMDVLLIQESELLLTDDSGIEEASRQYLQDRKAQAVLLLPMVARGQTVGLVELERREGGGAFTPDEMGLAQALANQAAVAVANAQMYEEIRRFSAELEQRVEERTHELAQALQDLTVERDRIQALYRITAEVAASLDLDQVLNRTLEMVVAAVGADQGSILLEDPDTSNLVHRAAVGLGEVIPPGGKKTRFRRGEGLAGWAMTQRKALLIDDILEDSRWVPDLEPDAKQRACMTLPLIRASESQGVMLLFSAEPGTFQPDHLRLAEAAATQIANAVGNAALYNLIREQAERLGVMLKQQQIEATKSQAILEGVADGVVVADAKGEIILFNVAAERILEIEREQALGRSTREMLGLYGAEGRTWLEAMGDWQAHPAEHAPEDFVADRLELGSRVVSVHVSPVIMGAEYLGTVSLFRDITAIVEADRAKSDFVSTVSHELRTPMTSIKGYADLVLMGAVGELTEQQQHFIGIIRNNANRLTSLVNDLLDISRIETGRIELDLKAVHVFEIVDQMVSMLQGRAQEKEIALTHDVGDDLPEVWGDDARIAQILTNLVGNAIYYTPVGGSVHVSAAVTDNEMLRVAVTDTGIGIAEENLTKIFGRFFRADDPLVQETPGTGLGLPITASLVEMHQGKIWVDSELGKGSTFYFTLPLAHAVQAALALSGPGPGQVLVVESEREMAARICDGLTEAGYKVTTAERREALSTARDIPLSLITLDIHLPDAGGFELLRQLRAQSETADVPVALVSLIPDGDDGFCLGALDYVGKPVDEGELLGIVKRVIRQPAPILVVDEDQDHLSHVKKFLRQHDVAVRTTGRGERAFQAAREAAPALILIDLRLKDTSSYEVLKKIRTYSETSNIPVVVMDSALTPTVRRRVKVLGAEQFQTRPFAFHEFIQAISALLRSADGGENDQQPA
ncbi:MAG: GAF domain-containing protein [Anaerolineae bacterium]|nr:GAF domain-containing protein [Anaerolineae bacterium]